MRILITGAKGMLAQAVRARFATDPDGNPNKLILTDVVADDATGSLALDITDLEAVMRVIKEAQPDLIINCAAYTNVDGAEQAAELAERVNALGPENLAKAAAQINNGKNGATLVHISTDYVFGGAKPIQQNEEELIQDTQNYVYSEDDAKNPQSVYGKTKLKGEEAITANTDQYYIFRTAWLYGLGGKNFVETMLAVADKQIDAVRAGEKDFAEVTVVDDQHGSPTYTRDLTDIIYQAVYQQIPFGIYNATNEGYTTWADFTRKIYELTDTKCVVRGISTEEYEKQAEERAKAAGEQRKVAPRPKNSQMSKAKLRNAGVSVPEWTDGLVRYLAERSA